MKEPLKVLYVEDEQDIQTIARIALGKIGGFNINVCSSGAEAIKEVAGFAPDIILLDVMMPEMDGLETYQNIREIPGCQGIPIVFMTARVQAHEIKNYLAIGAVDVIAKPFSPMTLADHVNTILSKVNEL